PLFPLNILLLPGEQVPLHIFEPRYRQLFDDAQKNDLPFGLPFLDESKDQNLVSVCVLNQVTKSYNGGEIDVIIECRGLFDLYSQEDRFAGKLYPSGKLGAEINLEYTEIATTSLLEKFADYIELKFGKRPKLIEIQHYKLMD